MSESPKKTTRYHVHYSGHVQGVGFRFTCQRLASRLNVTGFVRNLANGDVELLVEGTKAEIDKLLASVASAMSTKIQDTRINARPATGEFDGFEIRY